jgi:hypothetical protein
VLVMVGGDRVMLGGPAVTVFRGSFEAASVHTPELALAH